MYEPVADIRVDHYGSDARVGPAAVPAACPMGRLPVVLHGDSQ
jgi:hypothetical protein